MRPLSRSLAGLALSLFLIAPIARAASLQVEGPQDSLDGPPLINHCTLRKAIINANSDTAAYPQCIAGSGADDITFLSYFHTITFAYAGAGEDAALTGDLDITGSLSITGDPGGTTIDAASLDRVFHINPGALPGVVVTLTNLNIVNGSVSNNGGAIVVNHATLNLINCTISNSSAANGAAIYATNGATVNIVNSTISGNTASSTAGAILVDGGSSVSVTNSTITANSGGGVRNAGGTLTLRSSIVAGNSGTTAPNVDGTITSLGFNVVGPLGTASVTAATGDQLDVSDASVVLGPLQDNGGPTPTHALLAGSIAIDHGQSSGSTTDQRGLTRPCDDAGIANATGGDGADAGAFEVQAACSNTPPDAVDDSATVLENSGANTIDVLANDTDANGDTLTITAVTQGANGSVANNGTTVSYTPNPNFFGSDSFTYTVDDGHSATDTATVSVTVTKVNRAPVAQPDAYTMNQDTTLTVAAPGVLANDTDADSDPLTAGHFTSPAHGALSPSSNGGFAYTPNAGFTGSDSFSYQANDGTVDSNAATVTITVRDTQPPAISASVATGTLWPPNHDLVNVGLAVSASDNSGSSSMSLAVFSNEDDVTPANGDQSPDAKNVAAGTLRLRAERNATSNGRVYLIIVTATDPSQNTSRSCLTVTVPKSQSAADVAAVTAAAQNAAAQCQASGLAPAGYLVVGDGPVIGPKQ